MDEMSISPICLMALVKTLAFTHSYVRLDINKNEKQPYREMPSNINKHQINLDKMKDCQYNNANNYN